MQTYYYGLWLLAFGVVLINSKFIFRSIDNEEGDEDINNPNDYFFVQVHRLNHLEKYLNELLALVLQNNPLNNEALSFERQGSSIIEGDPEEFID